ncbi:MAG TPA: glycosyltransferase family 39 protein [Candidatus Kryptonia bacterium]|nr:glycosyltransferase family 39 protein [Candidatus Kryptonia bacterium]
MATTESSPLQGRAVDGARRFAALVCLGSSYQLAVTNFDVRWLVAATVSAVIVATGVSCWSEPPNNPQRLPRLGTADLLLRLVPGWLLMTITAALKFAHVSPRLVLWTWIAGAAWLVAGSWTLSRSQAVSTPKYDRLTLICGVFVVAAAASLRLWRIDAVPRYVHCDEGTMALAARAFYANPDRDWFAPPPHAGAYSIMQLFYALVGWGQLLFGFNLFGARLSDVVFGILSIALLFDGLRRVTNLRVATTASLLLAVNHCHLAYSRIASGYIQTAFVVALAFDLLSRVWSRPTYFNAALLGVAMALGVQTYPSSLVALPLLVTAVGLLAAAIPQRRTILVAPLVIFALSCATAGAPFGVAILQQGNELLGRSHEITIFSPQVMDGLKRDVYQTDSAVTVVAQQAWLALRGFHAGHDHQPQYGVLQPMADRYTAALMLPGAVLLVLGLRQFVAIDALVFTLGYLWFGLGMQWAPGFNRTTGALPLAMVLPAVALVQCAGTLWAGRAWMLRRARELTIAAALTLCVIANLKIYFVDYGNSLVWGDGPSEAGWTARRYARDYTVHLVDWPQPGPEGLRLIAGELPVTLPRESNSVSYVQTAPVSGSDLFILDDQDRAARDALLARFPAARVEQWRAHPVHGPRLVLVFVGEPRSPKRSAD